MTESEREARRERDLRGRGLRRGPFHVLVVRKDHTRVDEEITSLLRAYGLPVAEAMRLSQQIYTDVLLDRCWDCVMGCHGLCQLDIPVYSGEPDGPVLIGSRPCPCPCRGKP